MKKQVSCTRFFLCFKTRPWPLLRQPLLPI